MRADWLSARHQKMLERVNKAAAGSTRRVSLKPVRKGTLDLLLSLCAAAWSCDKSWGCMCSPYLDQADERYALAKHLATCLGFGHGETASQDLWICSFFSQQNLDVDEVIKAIRKGHVHINEQQLRVDEKKYQEHCRRAAEYPSSYSSYMPDGAITFDCAVLEINDARWLVLPDSYRRENGRRAMVELAARRRA